jgi:hypothetical protein
LRDQFDSNSERVQLSELEIALAEVRRENKELGHNNESLRDQATRSIAAVSSASEVQARLEAKYSKRSAERDAAREEVKIAHARVAELQVPSHHYRAPFLQPFSGA